MTIKTIIMFILFIILVYGIALGDFLETWRTCIGLL